MTLTEKNVCPFCGSFRHSLHSPTVWDRPDMRIYHCDNCGLVYLFPTMTEEQEKDFYVHYDNYLKARDLPYHSSTKDQFEKALPEARRRLSCIQSILRPEMRVLEIGSSTGAFLKLIKNRVLEVLGVEPNIAYAAYMNILGISHVRKLEDLNMDDREKFDVCVIFHVLEHLPDPLSYLKALGKGYLRSGGYLFIEVPNIQDALLTLYKCEQFIRFYYQSMHCCYLSHDTLQKIVEAAGFKTLELIPVQRYDLSNHMCWLQCGKPGGTGRYRKVFLKVLENQYARCLKQKWLCDTIFGIFKKV